VWKWFANVRDRNLQISGTVVQELTQEVAKIIGESEFQASNKRLKSFRKSNQIAFNKVYGEA